MKHTLFLALLASASTQAATLITSSTVDVTGSLPEVDASAVIVSSSQFATTIDSFDIALGTLESVTISFSFDATFSGTLGSTGGGASASYGGDFFVAGINLGGTGGGGGNGGGPNSPFSTQLGLNAPFSVTVTADSNPALFAALQSGSPVSVSWDTDVTATAGGTTLTGVSITGSAITSLEYTYLPVPEPSSSLLGILPAFFLLRRKR